MNNNLDDSTVAGFGRQWQTYDQAGLSPQELAEHFERYFRLFPWATLKAQAHGFDLGCGSGRWARLVAPRVGKLHCIDASADALEVARANLQDFPNCAFHHASVDAIPLPDESMDFGYSLGVLHHVPRPSEALRACVTKLRKGAPFLLYMYYAFDNQPAWYQAIWRASNAVRRLTCRLPSPVKVAVTAGIAAAVYWPLSRAARAAEQLGVPVKSLPLSAYRHTSFYTMKTDALDRFGTPLELRFTQTQIRDMMTNAGLVDVRFQDAPPYWCAVGCRA